MKEKILKIRIQQCMQLSTASECERRKVGAILLDPIRNVVLMDGYNGGPRGGSKLCGEQSCLRNDCAIKSGSDLDVSCHHAEMNVICNAAANGIRTADAWLIVNCSPCIICAKLIHHSGIKKVITIDTNYGNNKGIVYLQNNNVIVECVSEDGEIMADAFKKTGQIKVTQDPNKILIKKGKDQEEYGIDDLVQDSLKDQSQSEEQDVSNKRRFDNL